MLCCKGQILELSVNLQIIILNKTKLQSLPTSVRVAQTLQSSCLTPGVRSEPLLRSDVSKEFCGWDAELMQLLL